MIKRVKEKIKKSSTYAIRFLLFFLLALFLVPYTISYALFNQRVNGRGEIDIVVLENDVKITKVSSPTIFKNGIENVSPSYKNTSINFNVTLNNTNANVSYEVTIRNDGQGNVRFQKEDLTNNNSAFLYTIEGLDESTILSPSEEITFKVIISYTDEYKYNFPSSKSSQSTLEFVFQSTLRKSLVPLTGYIVEESSDISRTELGAPATLVIQNDNEYPVSFTLETPKGFAIYDKDGNSKTYSIAANSSETYDIYIKDTPTTVAIGMDSIVYVTAAMSNYEVTQTALIDSINITLPVKGKYQLLESGYDETPSDVDYTSIDTNAGGVFRERANNGEYTYYYRGKVNDNYFSFAGFTWRILRIDENTNIRLILDSLITGSDGKTVTSVFKSSNTASSMSAAISLVRLINDPTSTSSNSPIYGNINSTDTSTLRGWYNSKIKGTENEKYVVDSKFCLDTEGGNATSSGTSGSVFYFGPYQKIGVDTALYDPKFSCSADSLVTEKIGLLSADEYVFAGGAFRKNNTNFFLYNSNITSYWWTLSPAYYDESLSTVGVFYIDNNGYISDWPNGNTTKNSYGIRPVITVSGAYELLGTGTQSDPYHY